MRREYKVKFIAWTFEGLSLQLQTEKGLQYDTIQQSL